MADSIARQHDIDYLKSSGDYNMAYYDDAKAIGKALFIPTIDSMALKLGLGARSIARFVTGSDMFDFNTPVKGMSNEETKRLGELLQEKLDKDN